MTLLANKVGTLIASEDGLGNLGNRGKKALLCYKIQRLWTENSLGDGSKCWGTCFLCRSAWFCFPHKMPPPQHYWKHPLSTKLGVVLEHHQLQ